MASILINQPNGKMKINVRIEINSINANGKKEENYAANE